MLERTSEDVAAVSAGERGSDLSHNEGEFSREIVAIGASAAAVLDMLNDVTAEKRASILALAASAAGAELPRGQGAKSALSLLDAVKRAERTAAALQKDAPPSAITLVEHAAAQAIAMAIQNTVATDQQLDIIAQAVLARSAALLLSGGRRAQ